MPEPRSGESTREAVQNMVEEAKQEVTLARRPWYRLNKRGYVLLGVYLLQLVLFGILAWWVHVQPVIPAEVTITRELQAYPAPWLHTLMLVVSYPGNSLLLTILVVLTGIVFWLVDLRLEAVCVVALSGVSAVLNTLLKLLVERPRPSSRLVEVFQHAAGQSFPSGHVMAYLAFWGLLFSFGVLLFQGKHWWRLLLLALSAFFVLLVGPSRIYLGDHWASDVLGAYLIGGVLLGITLWIYLLFKERGLLETPHAQERARRSSVLRSFTGASPVDKDHVPDVH